MKACLCSTNVLFGESSYYIILFALFFKKKLVLLVFSALLIKVKLCGLVGVTCLYTDVFYLFNDVLSEASLTVANDGTVSTS